MPTKIASYEVDSAGDNTNTLTTPAFTPDNGEIIIIKGTTWSTGQTLNTPTGGSLTYSRRVTGDFGGFSGYGTIWTTTVSGSPVGMTISVAPAVSCRHHIVVERWGSAKLGTPAVASGFYSGTLSLPDVVLNTEADSSALSWCSVDVQSVNPSTRTYLQSATEDGLFDGSGGSNTVMYFAEAIVGAAGAYHIGMSLPGGQRWTLVGIEIEDASNVSKSLSESGAGSDAMSVHATLGLAEVGSGTDRLAVTSTVPARRGVTGWDLYSTLQLQAEYKNYYDSTLPMACPHDGTPLKLGPPNKPGVLYCPNGDFQYPDDWVQDTMSGM